MFGNRTLTVIIADESVNVGQTPPYIMLYHVKKDDLYQNVVIK